MYDNQAELRRKIFLNGKSANFGISKPMGK